MAKRAPCSCEARSLWNCEGLLSPSMYGIIIPIYREISKPHSVWFLRVEQENAKCHRDRTLAGGFPAIRWTRRKVRIDMNVHRG